MKALAADSLRAAAHSLGFSLLLAQLRPAIRILMFHGIGEPRHPGAIFRAQMAWLQRNFRVVPLEAVIARIREASAEPWTGTVLTFDDGLRNNFTVAYPILKQLGLPATFFVCPGLIDNGQWLWNHEARQRLLRLDQAALRDLSGRLKCGVPYVAGMVEWMKSLPLQQRREAEEQVRNATPDFSPTEDEHSQFDPMRWDDLLALDPALVTIGSHTKTHPILTTLDALELEDEIVTCRTELEGRLRRAVRFFCYPNGATDPRVTDYVGKTYEAAVTTTSGFLRPGESRYALPRIPAAPSMRDFAWRMHRPSPR